jgi:hypothetical protein
MTSRERILCVLAGEVPDRVPYYEAGIDYYDSARIAQVIAP